MQEAPALLIQQNRQQMALDRYRYTLSAVESQGIHNVRLRFLCQLAELILQEIPPDNYKPPGSLLRESPWKPKQYTALNQVSNG